MNWGGFPVAFRFPVQDFSAETKRNCWSYVLPTLTYADLTESGLYEAESAELFDPDQLIYIAVVAPKIIPPSRKNSLLWRRDGRLMSALVSYQPVVQENYLELYAPWRMLAEISPDRAVLSCAEAEGWFPDHIGVSKKKPSRARALIMPKGELPFRERDALCRLTMRELYEQDDGLYLKMLPLSPGGEGAVYSAAAFSRSRLFSEMIPDADGEKHRCLFGVLPGRRLLIDGFSIPHLSDPMEEGYGLGRAIRIAKDRGFSKIGLCARGLNPPDCEAEMIEDVEKLYALSKVLPLYDKVILTEYDGNGQIRTEEVDIDRRNKECVSSILSRRSVTAAN